MNSTALAGTTPTVALLAALMLAATGVSAQARAPVISPAVRHFTIPTASPAAQEREGASAFLIEAVGGTAGTFVGGGLLLLAHEDCDADDLSCILESLSVAGMGSIIGATAGTYLTGRAATTQPSLLGAGLGAVVGLATGVGVVKLYEEAGARGRFVPVISLAVTEGALSALGSRLLSHDR